jgi:hypothetical protein
MSHIFFSYSRKDSDTAREIVSRLRSVGFTVWQDIQAIRGGENWIKAIQNGVREAEIVLLLWSKASSESKWVSRELDQCLLQDKPIYPIRLDDTPLDPRIATSHGVRSNELDRLIADLPSTLRRQRSGLSLSLPLGAQQIPGVERWSLDEHDELVSVPLLKSSYANAAVVGLPDTVVGQPRKLYLCLHFTRGIDKVLVSEVYRQHKLTQPDDGPFVGLHITGPAYLNEYRMDNDNPAQWNDAVDTTLEAISELSKSRYPELHIFSQSILPLNLALGTRLWRFWRLYLYNLAGGDGDVKYKRVMEILP